MKNILVLWSGLLISGLLYCCDSSKADHTEDKDEKKENKKETNKEEAASPAIVITQKWDLPPILREISGLAYMGNNRFACIQDESGVIFIYNSAKGNIERQVIFGTTGDYEGLALVGKTAYVVRNDGKIFEVENLDITSPRVATYTTPLTEANDVEGIAYDAPHKRLLLAIKGVDKGSKNYKGIYGFDLKTKKLLRQPVFKLNLADSLLPLSPGKNRQKNWQFSEIAVHPATGDIYLTEASGPQLLVLNADGTIRSRYKLSSHTFAQPEGITFGPAGKLYISNEGKKEKGNILQVNIR